MAVSEQQFEEYINMMRNAIEDGSLGGGGGRRQERTAAGNRQESRSRAEDLRFRKAQQKILEENSKLFATYNKSLNKFQREIDKHSTVLAKDFEKAVGTLDRDFNLYSKLVSSSFNDAVGKLNYENLELLPEVLGDAINRIPLFEKENISTVEDMFEFFESIADKKALLESNEIQEYANNQTQETADSLELLSRIARREGISVETLYKNRAKLIEQVKLGTEVQKVANEAARGAWIGQLADKGETLKKKFDKLSVAVKETAKAFEDVVAPTLKFGVDWTESLTAFMAGMSPEELAKNTAEYRQSIRAAGMSAEEFRDMTETGTFGLTEFTGSLKDAVRVQSSAFEAARRMGVSNANMGAFMEQQVKSFEKFNTAFSVTADEFINMNKQIRDSSEINAQMYRLNQKQRANAHLEIQQTILNLRTMGLLQEQAMKVVEAMSAIGAKSPKERMKQAARLQAVGGAMGFGAESALAADIMRRGFKREGDRERFAELQRTMQQATGEFMGQGLGQEMMAMQMLQKTGLEDVLGPKSAFASLNNQQFQATKAIEDLNRERNEIAGRSLATLQTINTLMGSSLMPLLDSAIKLLGVIAAGKLLKGTAGGLLGGITTKAAGGGLMRGILMGAVRLLGPAGIIASIVGLVASSTANASEQGKGIEHEVEGSYLDKLGNKIKNIFGVERDELDVRNEEITKEYVKTMAKQYEKISDQVEAALQHIIPNLSRESRTTANRWGIKSVKTYDKEGDMNKMMLADINRLGTGGSARIKGTSQRSIIEKELEMKKKILQNAEVQEEKDTELIETTKQQISVMKDSLTKLTEVSERLDNPNYKEITDRLRTNDENQKERDETALKKSKHNKVMWVRSNNTAG